MADHSTLDGVAPGEYVPTADHQLVMGGLSWAKFEAFIEIRGEDAAGPRVAYIDGTLELLSRSRAHGAIQTRLAAIVEGHFDQAGITYDGTGSWLLRNAESNAAIEPDESYVVDDIWKSRPDLVLDVVWTSGGIDRLAVYRRFGIPEVWQFRENQLMFWLLRPEGYVLGARSELLPLVGQAFVTELLALEFTSDVRRELRKRLG